MRWRRIGKQAGMGQNALRQANPHSRAAAEKTNFMTLAILFAFASATLLGTGVVTAQFGLRYVEPLSGAAISVPTFTLLFLIVSPLILAGEPVVWHGLPIFIGIGLFFPALLTFLTFASNRALGPVITSTLGNLAPVFAVTLALVFLHEPLRHLQLLGLVIAVIGAVVITMKRSRHVSALAQHGTADAACAAHLCAV